MRSEHIFSNFYTIYFPTFLFETCPTNKVSNKKSQQTEHHKCLYVFNFFFSIPKYASQTFECIPHVYVSTYDDSLVNKYCNISQYIHAL